MERFLTCKIQENDVWKQAHEGTDMEKEMLFKTTGLISFEIPF